MKNSIGSRPSRPVIKAYSDVLTFGKYKGHTVEWVIEKDPSYILWLDDNKVAKVSDEIYATAEEAEDAQRWDEIDLGFKWEDWGIDVDD